MYLPEAEAKFTEIDCAMRNLGEEVLSLGTALEASDRVLADARMMFHAILERRWEIAADMAMLRATIRKADPTHEFRSGK